jgi:hypothetical protein
MFTHDKIIFLELELQMLLEELETNKGSKADLIHYSKTKLKHLLVYIDGLYPHEADVEHVEEGYV